MNGRSLLDLRFTNGEMVLCQLRDNAHPVCALSYEHAQPQRIFALGAVSQSLGGDPGGDSEGDDSGSTDANPFLKLGGSVSGGGGGPSFSAAPTVATAYSGAPAGLSNIRGGGATVEVFGSASFEAGGPAVSPFQSAGAPGACNAVSDLCSLTLEMFQYMPAELTQDFPRIGYGECVAGINAEIASSPEAAAVINSELMCQMIAFLRCMLPYIGRLFAIIGGGAGGGDGVDNAAEAQEIGAASLAVVQQCAQFVPGILGALTGDGADESSSDGFPRPD